MSSYQIKEYRSKRLLDELLDRYRTFQYINILPPPHPATHRVWFIKALRCHPYAACRDRL